MVLLLADKGIVSKGEVKSFISFDLESHTGPAKAHTAKQIVQVCYFSPSPVCRHNPLSPYCQC